MQPQHSRCLTQPLHLYMIYIICTSKQLSVDTIHCRDLCIIVLMGIPQYLTGYSIRPSMILSRAGVQALLKSDCKCWEPDSPDDMWLGSCFRRLGVPLTNSPAFHQVRHGWLKGTSILRPLYGVLYGVRRFWVAKGLLGYNNVIFFCSSYLITNSSTFDKAIIKKTNGVL